MEEGSTAYVFQSTPSARRATVFVAQLARGRGNFNPRPPRGGRRRAASANSRTYGNFNPRPPRGGRLARLVNFLEISLFQSTPSARRATAAARRTCATVCISIHALREEGDSLPTSLALREGIFQSTPSARRATTPSGTARGRPFDFNPRPPRGGRPPTSCRSDRRSLFQSTPSARRATDAATEERLAAIISIHALREEGDLRALCCPAATGISIHALREEGDSKSGEKIHHVCSIIHTCAQFEKELYEGSGEMQNKSC